MDLAKESTINFKTNDDGKIRILILGETKQGKSSLVDLLIRRDAEHIPWRFARGITRDFKYILFML